MHDVDASTAKRDGLRRLYWAIRAVLAALFAVGVLAYLTGDDSSKQAALGVELIAGVVVAVAILGTEYLVQRRERLREETLEAADRRQREAAELVERNRELRMTIGMSPSLRGIDLSGERLPGAYLRGKDLRGARLVATDLRGADLGDANLDGAVLIAADLTEANVLGASFTGAICYGTVFERVQGSIGTTALPWHDADAEIETDEQQLATLARYLGVAGDPREWSGWLRLVLEQRTSFRQAKLLGARFDGAQLAFASFEEADLSGASFVDAVLWGADLSGCRARSEVPSEEAPLVGSLVARLGAADLLRDVMTFSHADDSGGELEGILLQRPNFERCDLSNARLWNLRFAPEVDLTSAIDADVRTGDRDDLVLDPASARGAPGCATGPA